MRRILPIAFVSLAFVAAGTLSLLRAADEKPKNSIKDVMKAHKKGGLKDKVEGGTASADEKKELVALYSDLSKNDPPKGDKENWKKLCDALVKAAKEAQDGKQGAAEALKKAADCKTCHSAHKKAT
jgi:hypothetical protein